MHRGAAVTDRGQLVLAAERGAGLGGVLGAGIQGKTGRAQRGAGCVGRRRMGKTKGQADLFGANIITKVPLIRGKEGF